MNIDDAIEELEGMDTSKFLELFDSQIEAIRLAIEALKRIQGNRDGEWHSWTPLLPGETEE